MAITSHSPLLSSIQSQNPKPFSPLSFTHHYEPIRANPSSSISRRRTHSWIQASNKTQNLISRRPISQVSYKTQNPIFTLLKMPLIIAITAAALISPFKPSLALAAAPMPQVDTRSENVEADVEADVKAYVEDDGEDEEREMEEYLVKHPDNVIALRVLMGDRIKRDDIRGAIDLVNRLIEIEKDMLEWLVLRANLYLMLGEYGVAMEGYEEVLLKEPFRMQAFKGMLVAARRMGNETEGGDELGKVMRRIEEAMERCRREKRMGMWRDFKLLIAQFRGEDEERERVLEEYLEKYPDDVEAIRVLMGDRIKRDDIRGAIDSVNRLIEIEKDELEWLVLRANLFLMLDEYGVAMEGYEEVLLKEPFRMQAFNGMIVAAKRMGNETEGGDELGKVMRRIEEAMERCRREKRMGMLRDFKLLIAQFRVIELKYEEALKIYSELVKDEPRDFRPYLCQGMLYTLWGKKDEAKKSYEKYRRLIPRTHPYANYYDECMTVPRC